MDELTTLNGRRALVIDHQLQRISEGATGALRLTD